MSNCPLTLEYESYLVHRTAGTSYMPSEYLRDDFAFFTTMRFNPDYGSLPSLCDYHLDRMVEAFEGLDPSTALHMGISALNFRANLSEYLYSRLQAVITGDYRVRSVISSFRLRLAN
jgi:hypothetical protein